MSERGVFYGIGLGPGDPELITRKAERVLREVDWIFHPAGASTGQSFARRILDPLALSQDKLRPVSFCMSSNREAAKASYNETAALVIECLRQNESVAWITEGDPLFYSTYIYLHERLLEKDPSLRIEIIPGVSSPQAAAAYAGWPIARLDQRVAVASADIGIPELDTLLHNFACVFLMKASRVDSAMLQKLRNMSATHELLYMERISTPEQRIERDFTVLLDQKLPYFSLIMIRKRSFAANTEEVAP